MSRKTRSHQSFYNPCYCRDDDNYDCSNEIPRKKRKSMPVRKLISRKLDFRYSRLRLAHFLALLVILQSVQNATSQPLLNQIAVWLRARNPTPTSFPSASNASTTSAPGQNQQQQQQQQQQQTQFLPQPSIQTFQVQHNPHHQNVYPTSSEQLQNLIASNNVPLSQGIPVVTMDQNSITIMTPAVPGHIMPPPNNLGATGPGGVFVAQPIHIGTNNNNNNNQNATNTHEGNNVQSINVLPPPPPQHQQQHGAIVQVMPPTHHVSFDGHHFVDGNMLAGGNGGMHQHQFLPQGSGNLGITHHQQPLLPSGSANIGFIHHQQQPPMLPSGPGNVAGTHQQSMFPSGPGNFGTPQQQQQPQQGLISTGSGNIGVAALPANFPNDSYQYPAGFLLQSPTGGGQHAPPPPPPPPPPPIPKHLKGPAIIAVPKQPVAPPPPSPPSQSPMLIPQPTHYFGSVKVVGNKNPLNTGPESGSGFSPTGLGSSVTTQHIPPSASGNGISISHNQPILVPSIHPVPAHTNQSPAFPHFVLNPPLLQPLHPSPTGPELLPNSHQHMISMPENAILELNRTKEALQPALNESLFQQQQFFHVQLPHVHQQHQEMVYLQQDSREQLHQQEKVSTASRETSHTELSSEFVGNSRKQRKRQPKQRGEKQPSAEVLRHYEKQQASRGNILRSKPLLSSSSSPPISSAPSSQRATQIPFPDEDDSENNYNDIDNHHRPPSISDYSLSTIVNLPSTTITGSWEYPDPPTPPNYESMNAIKNPSPYEDSPEVGVNIPGLSPADVLSSGEKRRLRGKKKQLQQQQQQILSSAFDLHNSPFQELKRVSSTSSSGTTAAEASNQYRSVTTVAGSPATSRAFDVASSRRDITTYPTSIAAAAATTRDLKKSRSSRNKSKSSGKRDFRPSPEIHSFEDTASGVKSYITILPPITTTSDESDEANVRGRRERGMKSFFGKFEASESKNPPYEIGFKPVSRYTSTAFTPASTTKETMYFDMVREIVSKAPPINAWTQQDVTGRHDRNVVTSSDGLTFAATSPYHGYTTLSSKPSTEEFVKAGWKVRDHQVSGDDGKRQVTTSASSERVEDWRFPDTTDGSPESSSRIYFGNGKFGPPNCDKFHRFGFCPMNSGYPTNQVEKIAKKCSALLSHLIAPLPKADVRYDVIVAKNGSMLKGKSATSSGWSWKSFSGKPVCDTKEVKVVPGWAKNEQGEWLVILQTKAWKQEAQITLCAPQVTHYKCNGNRTTLKHGKDCVPLKIKCVQRFTAQRLAVLDPENTDRCPVLRSVFLPSACVCLNDNGKPGKSSSLLPSEELSASSSNTNMVKVSSKSSRSKSKGKKGKGSKNTNKKKSSSKKSSKGSKHSSSRTSKGTNAHGGGSSEENKSDMLDTAADSSTSARTHHQHTPPQPLPSLSPSPPATISKHSREKEEDSATSSPEEDEENNVDDRPRAENLKGEVEEEEVEDDADSSNQNEVDADDEELRSKEKSGNNEEETEKVSTTVTSASYGDASTISPDAEAEDSASEDDTESEDKKNQDNHDDHED